MAVYNVIFVYQPKWMIKGSQTLTKIFPSSFTSDAKRKGVGSIYTAERDACLAYRFYYYYHLKRKRIDDAISDMEREFFISATTIAGLLTANDLLLKDIQNNQPTRNKLTKRYPHFNWN